MVRSSLIGLWTRIWPTTTNPEPSRYQLQSTCSALHECVQWVLWFATTQAALSKPRNPFSRKVCLLLRDKYITPEPCFQKFYLMFRDKYRSPALFLGCKAQPQFSYRISTRFSAFSVLLDGFVIYVPLCPVITLIHHALSTRCLGEGLPRSTFVPGT